MSLYRQVDKLPKKYISQKLKEFFIEDIPKEDPTSLPLYKSKSIVCQIEAGESLVFVGVDIIKEGFKKEEVKIFIKDGDQINQGEKICTIKGCAYSILKKERVILNLIQRLSGIASLTKEYVLTMKNTNIDILDTRKTTPGIRTMEKFAVYIGGGKNHRLNLSDSILIKDNHLKFISNLCLYIKALKKEHPKKIIEIEIEDMGTLKQALLSPINAILLDNMKADKVSRFVKKIRQTKKGKSIFIEASGGITLKNIKQYQKTGINAISIGALTHSATSKDIKLETIKHL